MEMKKQYESIVALNNSLEKLRRYYNWYISNEENIDIDNIPTKSELYQALFGFIQLNIILSKENLVTKNNQKKMESKMYDSFLENALSQIATKEDDDNFNIDGVIQEKTLLFSNIKHKLAHGDYYYDIENNNVVLNLEKKEVKINIESFLFFSQYILDNQYASKKENTFTRHIILNNSKRNLNKKLETEDDVKRFLKLNKFRMYNIFKNDFSGITSEDKLKLENWITTIQDSNGNIDHIEEIEKFMLQDFNDNCQLTIHDKDIQYSDEIKQALLKNNKYGIENMELLTYFYGNTLSKLADERYPKSSISFAIYYNSQIIRKLISISDLKITNKKELLNETTDIFRFFFYYNEEIHTALNLSKFVSLYGYTQDKILKEDRNYHYNRENYFDYGKLNLSSIVPSTNKINELWLENEKNRYNSFYEKINTCKILIENYRNQIKSSLEIYKKNPGIAKYINVLKNKLIAKNEELQKLEEQIPNYERDLIKITTDYEVNYKYFQNYSIIEGIRNSISHSGVKIINAGMVDNYNDIILEFENQYKDVLHFKLNISLYNFQQLFVSENINELEKYFNEKIKQPPNEEKVLQKNK